MTVYLVGAGPGDPGLLTRRGAELLARADVVVHDRLSAAELLDLAPAPAERIDVGKAPKAHRMSQEQINALLVERGLAGQTVVRLKGGDPFVFARGSEEAGALADGRRALRGGARHHLGARRARLRRHPGHAAVLVHLVHRGHRPRGPVERRRHGRLGCRRPHRRHAS